MTIGILALAAGQSCRFGADKRAASLADGRRVMDVFLSTLAATKLPYLVCLSDEDDDWANYLKTQGVNFYQCENARSGMGSTLAEGISQVDSWSGVIVCLADMPWVQTETFLSLATHIGLGGIVIPTHRGRRGNPVGFSDTYFPELKDLYGDRGAQKLLTVHAEHVLELEVADNYIHADIDTPDDLVKPPGS